MPFDINGTFSRNYDFETDRINGLKIMSDRVDGEFDNYATAMNQTLLRTGEAPMSANLRMGSFRLTGLGDGSVANPSVTFTNDASSGLYRVGANQLGISIAGVKRAQFDSTGIVGVLNATGAGMPLAVNSTDSTQEKIGFYDNGTLKAKLGSSGSGFPAYLFTFEDSTNQMYCNIIKSIEPNQSSWNSYCRDTSFGPASGTATDATVSFHNTNSSNVMSFYSHLGGVQTLDASLQSTRGFGFDLRANSYIFRKGDASQTYLQLDNTGLTILNSGSLVLGNNTIKRSDGSTLYSGAVAADVSIYSPSTGIHLFKDSSAADKVKFSNTGDVDAKGSHRNTFGAVTAPGASANAYLWRDATLGHALQGSGSSYDASLVNNAGNRVIGVNTGVYKAEYNGNVGASSQNSGELGWRDLFPQTKTGAYTLVLNDRGTIIPITTGGVAIPDNSSVAFPVGSMVSVYNDSASNQTISMVGTDTLRLTGTASTGSRTLAQRGMALLTKVKTTEWACSGAGVS